MHACEVMILVIIVKVHISHRGKCEMHHDNHSTDRQVNVEVIIYVNVLVIDGPSVGYEHKQR